jgi:ubiquinone/menaquinone biosynthesis C-methylase UbiE/predicted transcriptional regulator
MQTQINMIAEVRKFMKNRVILTAAELDLFTKLDQNPISAKDLAAALDLDERATTRILDCLITFELLEKQDNCYRTTQNGSYLSSLHPQSILHSIKHAIALWNNWNHLTTAIKEGTNPHLQPFSDKAVSDEERKAFIGSMHLGAGKLSRKISDAYDSRPFKRLLDIGGGSGAYTIAFLKKNPQLQAIIYDLDGVIPIAEEKIKEVQFQNRVNFVAGDYNKDELPGGCDLALLSAVIHQNSSAQNLNLFQKIYRALESGGALLIRDHVMDTTRTQPAMGALFALNMLVSTSAGDTYTFDEIKNSLETTGFEKVEMLMTGQRMDCLVEAKKLK